MIVRTSLVVALAFAATAAAAAETGNVARGKNLFSRTCQNSHAAAIGVNKIGPSLHGVVGRKAASVPDFAYSESMKANAAAGGVWTPEAIDAYLADPRSDKHGVKMFFKGFPKARDRADVIAYLKTLK